MITLKDIADIVEKGAKSMIIIGSIIITIWLLVDYANATWLPAIGFSLIVGAVVAILHDPIKKNVIFYSNTKLENTLSEFYAYTNLKTSEARSDYAKHKLDHRVYIESHRKYTESVVKTVTALNVSKEKKMDALNNINEQAREFEYEVMTIASGQGWMGR